VGGLSPIITPARRDSGSVQVCPIIFPIWCLLFVLTPACSSANPRTSVGRMAPSRGPQTLARTLHQTLSNHRGPVHVVRYSKGSAKYVLSGGQDRTVRLWNPDLGTEIKKFEAHGYEVLSIAVSVICSSFVCCVLMNKTL
jgi:WD40 repeat protein